MKIISSSGKHETKYHNVNQKNMSFQVNWKK